MNRYAVIAGIGAPILLMTLSMLARTELVIGDRVRAAIEARAGAVGADIEVLTVGPSGLWGIELERVSARVPRGAFAVEVDIESIEITPSLGSLFGEVRIEEIDVHHGVVAIVPWSESVDRPTRASTVKPSAGVSPKKTVRAPIDVTLNELEVIALNDAYRSEPLQLTRVEFAWTRGEPIARLAGYGNLPDKVPFSIVASDGVYRLQPQRRTQIDRWVSPPAQGVQWPVALQVRDIRLCLDCENVVALEDIEIALPAWRADVRITAPVAEVHRAGAQLSLGAPEMALVDAKTRDFAVRITESAFGYALDTGHLDGRLELAAADGGKLRSTWSWNAEDFVIDFLADDFPLESVWHLAPLSEQARPGRMTGRSSISWDMRHRTLGANADLRLDHLYVRVPFTDEEIDIAGGRFELDAFADARGRAVSIPRAALTLGGATPFEGSLQVVDAARGASFEAEFHVAEQDVQELREALPKQWTEVVEGGELRGSFGFDLRVAGHSAFPESLVLDGELLGDVTVVSEGTADATQVGRTGPPPMHEFPRWTPLSKIGRNTWEVVLAAEDAGFMQHDGFAWAGIQRAMIHNLTVRRPERGGSTISQQVAKNLFLSGQRTLARKLQEAYLTWRLESVLPKERILEIYLNIAEWGRTVRGIGAASEHYFGVAPNELAPIEVATLAAILPNPHRFGGWIDDGKIATSRLQKIEHILRNLRYLRKITLTEYRRLWGAAQLGELGRLKLEPCDDEGKNAAPSCKQ